MMWLKEGNFYCKLSTIDDGRLTCHDPLSETGGPIYETF